MFIKTCKNFDLKKAYVSLLRRTLLNFYIYYNLYISSIAVIRALYKNSKASDSVDRKWCYWFQIDNGVFQGCVIVSWLFNLNIEVLLRKY